MRPRVAGSRAAGKVVGARAWPQGHACPCQSMPLLLKCCPGRGFPYSIASQDQDKEPMPRAALTDHSPASARPSSSGSGRFASAAVRAVLRRRVMEMCGLLVAIGAIALGVALASHNPADPSFNTSTHGPTTNLAGPAGAIVSDVMLQCFGFAAALPCLALLAWAFRLATHRGLGSVTARLLGLLAGLPLAAAALSLLPLPQGLPVEAGPGGIVGPVTTGLLVDGACAACWGRSARWPARAS